MIITISIKQPNTDYNWALVNQGNVENVIVADVNFINNSGISAQYDFVINLAGYPNITVGPGYLYDPIQNTFTAPLIDPVAILVIDFSNIQNYIESYLSDAQNATSQQIKTAVTNFKNQTPLTASASSLCDALQSYFLAGGN